MRIITFLFLTLLCIACNRNLPEYSSIPEVEFLSAATTASESNDNTIAFTFMLYDGDGNVGLDAADTSAPFIDEYQQNFYATPFYIENGVTYKLPYNFSYRIPRLREEGNDKFIKAKVAIDFALATASFPYDSVFFSYYVYDRALNKSNTDTSSVLIF